MPRGPHDVAAPENEDGGLKKYEGADGNPPALRGAAAVS